MAKALIEPVSAWMRIWNDDEAVYGDAFDFFVGIRYITKEKVEVCGLQTEGRVSFTMAHVNAIKRELARVGVTDWEFKRIKNGIEKPVKGRT